MSEMTIQSAKVGRWEIHSRIHLFKYYKRSLLMIHSCVHFAPNQVGNPITLLPALYGQQQPIIRYCRYQSYITDTNPIYRSADYVLTVFCRSSSVTLVI